MRVGPRGLRASATRPMSTTMSTAMCSTSSMCQDYRFGRLNPGNFLSFKKELLFFCLSHIITVTEPNTPLNDADHVGSFNFKENFIWGI